MNNKVLIAIFGAALLCLFAVMFYSTHRPKNDFEYIDERWKAVEPSLIKYKETGSINTGFTSLSGVTADEKGRIYACGDSGIEIYDSKGEKTGELKGGAFKALAASGDTLYAAKDSKIVKYKGFKKVLEWDIKLKETSFIAGLALSGGNIYAADSGNKKVVRFNESGKFQNLIGEGLILPGICFDVTVDEKGFVYIINPGKHSIEKYEPGGKKLSSFGRYGVDIEGFSGCCNPTGIFYFGGDIFTCEKGLYRVKYFDEKGRFKGVVAGPYDFGRQTGYIKIAVDPKGRVLAADPLQKSIRIFEKKQG
jgi:hypothetical protein